MAMFNSKEEDGQEGRFEMEQGSVETIIGTSVKVDGDFTSEGDVLVQGVVNGSLKTKGNLKVEEGAKIKADVEAANATVNGEITGNVTIGSNLELGAPAKISGDIVTKILSIEPGAVLNGHCAVSATNTEPKISEVQELPNKK
jgi:cytoskeletal protein CcmA (bactofilin family)